jgi:hypothetical protein
MVMGLRVRKIPLYRFHPEYGFWGTPDYNQEVYYSEFSKSVRIRHDSAGNRSSFATNLISVDSKSVIFLGGSNTWGAGVENDKTFSAILEKVCALNVANLGHCSFGIDQMALVLNNYIKKFSPNYVVLELHPWVVHRILRRSALGFPKPYFTINENLQLVKLSRLYRVDLFRKVSARYQEFVKSFGEYLAGINTKNVRNDFDDPIFQLWKQSYYENMYNLVTEILIRIHKQSVEANAKLIVLLGPTKQEIDNKDNSLELIDFSLPRRKIIQILDDLEIMHLDLLPRFLEIDKGGGTSAMFGDGHLNERGHQIFAHEISRLIH